MSVIEQKTVQKDEREDEKLKVSRRAFLKTFGVGAAAVTSGVSMVAMGDSYGAFPTDLTDEQLISMWTKMLQARWYDRKVADLMLAGDSGFRGYGHFACGHEGVAVGVSQALKKGDWIQGYHRSHHHGIAQGADIRAMAAEINFKATGTNRGFGGSMHIMQKDVGMLGEDGIVGPGGTIGAGAAFGLRAKGTDNVAVTYGGDAHSYSPYAFVALHEAQKHMLPFIYVIEANGYMMSTPFSKQTYMKSPVELARGLSVNAETVDGQSALSVYGAAKRAVARARAGEGPTLLDVKTYRYYDHFGPGGAVAGKMGAKVGYRPDRELQHWLRRDPIDIHRSVLETWEVLTAARADEIEAGVRQEIEDAFAFALSSPSPKAEDAMKYVYVDEIVPPLGVGGATV